MAKPTDPQLAAALEGGLRSRLIILERDGVINQLREEGVTSPDEWEPIAGSMEAIARFTHANFRVVVITNLPAISRGLTDVEAVMAIHEKMHKSAGDYGGVIEAVLFCPHGEKEHCNCRKPRPGLFNELADRLHMDLTGVPAVGDTLRDVEAARAVGAQPILLRSGKGSAELKRAATELEGVPVFDDLAAFADALIEME